MTSRTVLLIDRIATLLLAAVLIAAGVAAVWWWSGEQPLPERSDTTAARDLIGHYWWPWATGACGVILILVGLRWIAAHIANRRVSHLALSGSAVTGKLTVSATHAIATAAEVFQDTPGVRNAKGGVVRDRGQLVARIKATIEPEADLALIASSADEVSAQLAQVLGRKDLRCSVELSVASRGRALTRAH